MIFVAMHLLGYIALALVLATGTTRAISYNHARSHTALMIRITKLEAELGLGIFWAKDEPLKPELSRPQYGGYSSLHEYAFRCYGCGASVVYADYEKRPKARVDDARHLFCNHCLPRSDRA